MTRRTGRRIRTIHHIESEALSKTYSASHAFELKDLSACFLRRAELMGLSDTARRLGRYLINLMGQNGRWKEEPFVAVRNTTIMDMLDISLTALNRARRALEEAGLMVPVDAGTFRRGCALKAEPHIRAGFDFRPAFCRLKDWLLELANYDEQQKQKRRLKQYLGELRNRLYGLSEALFLANEMDMGEDVLRLACELTALSNRRVSQLNVDEAEALISKADEALLAGDECLATENNDEGAQEENIEKDTPLSESGYPNTNTSYNLKYKSISNGRSVNRSSAFDLETSGQEEKPFAHISPAAVFSALPKQIRDQFGEAEPTLDMLYQIMKSGLRDHIPRDVWVRALNEFSSSQYSPREIQNLAALAGVFTFRAMMLDVCEAPARYFWGCLHKMVYGRTVKGTRSPFRAMSTLYGMISECEADTLYPGAKVNARFANSAKAPANGNWIAEEKAEMKAMLLP